MKNNPTFSIIIPTYNRRKLLQRAVESVINQTLNDWELIIIDDGSNDDTDKYVSQLNDERIRYHYQENKGESSARNLGIKISHGLYISFLDSDDEILPNYLSDFKKNIDPNISIYCCGVQLKWTDQKIKPINILPNNKREEHIIQVLSGDFNLLPFIFIKSLNLSFDETIELGEDFQMLLPLIVENRPALINKVNCIVYEHKNRFTRNKYKKNQFNEFEKSTILTITEISEKLIDLIPENKIEKIKQKKIKSYILGIASNQLGEALTLYEKNKMKYNLSSMKTSIYYQRLKGVVKSLLLK